MANCEAEAIQDTEPLPVAHQGNRQTELRHSALSQAESAVMQFEVEGGLEWEHASETDLKKRHHHWEEGDLLESSALRFARYFLAFLRMDTHLFRAFGNERKLPSGRVCLPC